MPRRWILLGASLGIVLVAGCPITPSPVRFQGAAVVSDTGSLVVNQANTVTVSTSVLDAEATVETVTVDLSAIGGPGTLPLPRAVTPNLWSVTLTVTPADLGTQQVNFTARDSNGSFGFNTISVEVVATGGGGGGNGTNAAPVLANAFVDTELLVGVPRSVLVAVTATDTDGTVQAVTADLRQIGGLENQVLTLSGTEENRWSATPTLTPPVAGTPTIVFTAIDNGGATRSLSTTTVVNNPIP